jgi:hypothetical protein
MHAYLVLVASTKHLLVHTKTEYSAVIALYKHITVTLTTYVYAIYIGNSQPEHSTCSR